MNSMGLIHYFSNKKTSLIIVFVCMMLTFPSAYSVNSQNTLPTQQFMINGAIYQLEIAQTRKQLQMGLMGRHSLAKNKGMMFAFPNYRRHAIWMKNMSIPLTVAWLDNNMNVIDVQKLRPCHQLNCPTFKPQKPSSYVVELNYDNQIAIGDQLRKLWLKP